MVWRPLPPPDFSGDEREVRLYRCARCGKWSHAKRQPKDHERWVHEGDPEFDSSRAHREMPSPYDGDVRLGHSVRCGPFLAWVAAPLEVDFTGKHRRKT